MSHASRAAGAALVLLAFSASAKPIAYQDGTSLMAEYGAGTMTETQLVYAPRYWWSGGGGFLHLEAGDGAFTRDIGYLRGNVLVKRWNLPRAQANIFAWGGAGEARSSDGNSGLTGNAGAQLDYETLRLYSSLRSDVQRGPGFEHVINTAQLGFAPYAHDWDRLATWVLLQGRTYTGGLYEGVEGALLLRFFKSGVWFEAGATQDGKLQTMLMFNF